MKWRDPSPRTVDYALAAVVLVASVTEALLIESRYSPRSKVVSTSGSATDYMPS